MSCSCTSPPFVTELGVGIAAPPRQAGPSRYALSVLPPAAIGSYAPERILPALQSGLRAFVGQTAWEELAPQWVREQGYAGALPFVPEVIGSHWSRSVQADVVAISWAERAIVIGECTWADHRSTGRRRATCSSE